jgi:hypothetical protein
LDRLSLRKLLALVDDLRLMLGRLSGGSPAASQRGLSGGSVARSDRCMAPTPETLFSGALGQRGPQVRRNLNQRRRQSWQARGARAPEERGAAMSLDTAAE